MSRCRWISVYLSWRTAHTIEPQLSCSIVSIVVHFLSCQLPNCNLFTLHSYLIVFWERDITSELHGTPVHISTIIYTSIIYCFYFLSFAITTIISTRVSSFVNNKNRGIDNPSVLVGSKVICFCVQVQVK